MERFLLLRDNQEKGPFSLEELRAQGLKNSDLVWMEGHSIAWDYPFNFAELKGHVIEGDSQRRLLEENDRWIYCNSKVSNAAETSHSFQNVEPDQTPGESLMAGQTTRVSTIKYFFTGYGVWIMALIFLVAGTTWVMKKAVEVFSGKHYNQGRLTQVVQPLTILPEGQSPQKAEDVSIQNALSRELVPVDTTQVKEPGTKKIRFKELKKYLRVESNEYKVGVFGGINNLRLTVINNSAYVLNKVVLQVDYLKPKGETIETERFTYFSIPPHGKKTLEIPPSKRGVKVKYKILDAKSKEYKLDLVEA